MKMGEWEDAERELQDALGKDAKDPDTLANLITVGLHLGKNTARYARWVWVAGVHWCVLCPAGAAVVHLETVWMHLAALDVWQCLRTQLESSAQCTRSPGGGASPI